MTFALKMILKPPMFPCIDIYTALLSVTKNDLHFGDTSLDTSHLQPNTVQGVGENGRGYIHSDSVGQKGILRNCLH